MRLKNSKTLSIQNKVPIFLKANSVSKGNSNNFQSIFLVAPTMEPSATSDIIQDFSMALSEMEEPKIFMIRFVPNIEVIFLRFFELKLF